VGKKIGRSDAGGWRDGKWVNPRPLNERQREFARQFLISRSATDAARAAGYNEKSCRETGFRLTKHPLVMELIQAGLASAATKAEITAERVLAQMARLGFADLRDAFDAEGKLKPPADWDPDLAAAITSVEVSSAAEGAQIVKVRMADKRAALADMARVLGMMRDNLTVTGKGGGPIQVTISRDDDAL